MSKKIVLLFCAMACAYTGFINAQNCASCTITVAGPSSSNYILNPGDLMCITSTGTVSGNIIMNGGVLCIEGSTSGNITVNDGVVNNYGYITGGGSYINHDGGSFYNYGSIQNGDFTSVGHDIRVENYGSIITGYIDVDYNGPGAVPFYLNEGSIQTASITIDSGSFSNADSILLSQNLVIGTSASFFNAGVLNVGGNVNISSGNALFHTECTVMVTGNLNNMGTITGPTAPCGGFVVSGFASNQANGNIATDGSYIDICEQGNPNGLNNMGTLGPNFTQCSCTGACISFMTVPATQYPAPLCIYPNPAADEINISGHTTGIIALYDMNGRLITSLSSGQSERTVISMEGIPPGVYILEVNGEHHRIVHR